MEEQVQFSIPAIRLKQPIGEFFIASISHERLFAISHFDVRRMLKNRDVEEYLGIQRPLNPSRVNELKEYVRTVDSCFPTGIVLAVDGKCAEYDEKSGRLTLSNYLGGDAEPILYRQIAKVLDGQHRIAGLEGLDPSTEFDLNVSIFVDIELEDQAYIFSIVNISQTKVNKSLAYDLYELAQTRSPQKTAHNIAIGLDRNPDSPFHKRIKRLGSATPGRQNEVLSQATVVEGLLPLITRSSVSDRDTLKRLKNIATPSQDELKKFPLRGLFAEGKDVEIYFIISNFFEAICKRWPFAWADLSKGAMLSKTNGYRALIRVFPHLYLNIGRPGQVIASFQYSEKLKMVKLEDSDFNIENFIPGTSGEAALAKKMLIDMNLISR